MHYHVIYSFFWIKLNFIKILIAVYIELIHSFEKVLQFSA